MSQLSETLQKNYLMNNEFLYKSAPAFGTSGLPMESNPGVPGSKAASQDAEKYIKQLLAAEANAIVQIKADDKFVGIGEGDVERVDYTTFMENAPARRNYLETEAKARDIGVNVKALYDSTLPRTWDTTALDNEIARIEGMKEAMLPLSGREVRADRFEGSMFQDFQRQVDHAGTDYGRSLVGDPNWDTTVPLVDIGKVDKATSGKLGIAPVNRDDVQLTVTDLPITYLGYVEPHKKTHISVITEAKQKEAAWAEAVMCALP